MDRSLGTYPRGQGRAGLTGLRRFWGNTGGAMRRGSWRRGRRNAERQTT